MNSSLLNSYVLALWFWKRFCVDTQIVFCPHILSFFWLKVGIKVGVTFQYCFVLAFCFVLKPVISVKIVLYHLTLGHKFLLFCAAFLYSSIAVLLRMALVKMITLEKYWRFGLYLIFSQRIYLLCITFLDTWVWPKTWLSVFLKRLRR